MSFSNFKMSKLRSLDLDLDVIKAVDVNGFRKKNSYDEPLMLSTTTNPTSLVI